MTVAVTGKTDLIDESEITKEKYKSSAKDFSIRDLLRILSFLSKTQFEIRQTTNQKMKLEIALAQLIDLPRTAEVDELIQEIRKLKKDGIPATNQSTQTQNSTSEEKKSPVVENQSTSAQELDFQFSQKTSKGKTEVLEPSNQYKLPPSIEMVISQWEKFVFQINNLNEKLGSTLKNSKIARIENNIIYIYSPSLRQNATTVNSNREFLFKQSKEFFGKGFKIFISDEPPQGEPLITINQNHLPEKKEISDDHLQSLSELDLKMRQEIIDKLKAHLLN